MIHLGYAKRICTPTWETFSRWYDGRLVKLALLDHELALYQWSQISEELHVPPPSASPCSTILMTDWYRLFDTY